MQPVPEAIDSEAYKQVQLPKGAENLQNKPKFSEELKVDYEDFKNYLIRNKQREEG